jgi:isoleucyl-tRNA synthetase
MEEMDRYAMVLFDRLAATVRKAYEEYEFYVLFHAVNNFCSVDLSAFYLNVLKDRMYCSPAGDPARRSAQTAIFEIARGLLSLTAPVLSFTTEEAWGYLPAYPGKPESVFLSDLPGPLGVPEAEAVAARWERILALRSEVAQPLETARREKVIGSGQDALVTISPGPFADLFETHAREIRDALIVSGIAVGEVTGPGMYESAAFPGLKVTVEKAPWEKCDRCWNHAPEVGTLAGAPELCARCAAAVGKR